MQEHMRTHGGGKPHMCALCGYDTAVKSNLTRHVKAVHQKKAVNLLKTVAAAALKTIDLPTGSVATMARNEDDDDTVDYSSQPSGSGAQQPLNSSSSSSSSSE